MSKKGIQVLVSVVAICIVILCAVIYVQTNNNSVEKESNNESTVDDVYDTSTTESTTIVTTAKPKLSLGYTILATGTEDNGDVYELVGEQSETLNNGGIKIGVIKNNEWLVEMTSDISFVNNDGYLFGYNLDEVLFEYCGTGSFFNYTVLHSDALYKRSTKILAAFNSEIKKGIVIEKGSAGLIGLRYETTKNSGTYKYYRSIDFKFRDKLVYQDYDGIYLLDLSTMNEKFFKSYSTEVTRLCSQYSEGLIFAQLHNSVGHLYYGFVNSEMNSIIDLSEYKLTTKNGDGGNGEYREDLYFENEECIFYAWSKSSTIFEVTIDKTGKVVKSVEK